ncbi:MAG: hypothetical protein C0514_08940 [Candidatus Puniceispirillum sp.]|nr:hypothetical protein [Candidatus Puniceispirillum sp.]
MTGVYVQTFFSFFYQWCSCTLMGTKIEKRRGAMQVRRFWVVGIALLGIVLGSPTWAVFTIEDLDRFEALAMQMMSTACLDKAPVPREDLAALHAATKDPRLLDETQSPCEVLKEFVVLFAKAAPLTRTYERDVAALDSSARPLDGKTYGHATVALLSPDCAQAIARLKGHYAHQILHACPQKEMPLQCHYVMTRFFEEVSWVEGYWRARRKLEARVTDVVSVVEKLQEFTPGMTSLRVYGEDVRD